MEEEKIYGIYIKVDAFGRIVEINSEGLLEDINGYILIDQYESDFPYAQGNYFPDSIIDNDGIWRYVYDPSSPHKWRERTKQEMRMDQLILS